MFVRHWRDRTLEDLLDANELVGVREEPLPHDGWSGADLTLLRRPDGARFVLKRTSLTRDWIARSTDDHELREGVFVARDPLLPWPLVAPYFGAAIDRAAEDAADTVAILMPDLSTELIAWDRPSHDPAIDDEGLERVLWSVAGIHALPWRTERDEREGDTFPWCRVRERLLLLARPTARGYVRDGVAAGARFLEGWEAFDRSTTPEALRLIESLGTDPSPLLDAMDALPPTGLHGDLKLSNVALLGDGRVAIVDWSMVGYAPVGVELGWFLVSNVASLPAAPDTVLDRYRAIAERTATGDVLNASTRWVDSGRDAFEAQPPGRIRVRGPEQVIGDWEHQVAIAMLVGLLLRGWRKGLDAEAGVRYPWGGDGASDLAWWCERAVEAGEELGIRV